MFAPISQPNELGQAAGTSYYCPDTSEAHHSSNSDQPGPHTPSFPQSSPAIYNLHDIPQGCTPSAGQGNHDRGGYEPRREETFQGEPLPKKPKPEEWTEERTYGDFGRKHGNLRRNNDPAPAMKAAYAAGYKLSYWKCCVCEHSNAPSDSYCKGVMTEHTCCESKPRCSHRKRPKYCKPCNTYNCLRDCRHGFCNTCTWVMEHATYQMIKGGGYQGQGSGAQGMVNSRAMDSQYQTSWSTGYGS